MWNVTRHTHPCENQSFPQVPHAQFTASTGVVLLMKAASTMIVVLMRGAASAVKVVMTQAGIILVRVADEQYVEVSGCPPSLAIPVWCCCGGSGCHVASAGVVVLGFGYMLMLAGAAGGASLVGPCALDELLAELLEEELKIAW